MSTSSASSALPFAGHLARVSPLGICYVADADSGDLYSCAFSKVRGFCGQSLEAAGILAGARVRFSLGPEGSIEELAIDALRL